MKKLAILVICLLACLTLFTGCTDPKGGDGQDSNVNSGVEVDITDPSSTDEPAGSDTLPDGADDTDEPAGSGTSPDDFTYRPKDPENNGGIVVTPKE